MPSHKIALALLLAATLAVSGCKKRTVHAATPAPPPAPPAESVPTLEPKPETPPAPSPSPASSPSSAPVSPPAKPATTKPRPDPAKPAPPQISPGLSPQQQAEAEHATKEDINVAERNLQAVYGRQLNAAQHDLVEKIHGFLGQAHEAMRASDWVRARNLAQKAHVLSTELLNSL